MDLRANNRVCKLQEASILEHRQIMVVSEWVHRMKSIHNVVRRKKKLEDLLLLLQKRD
jgi:hypothetical protein